MSKRLASDRPGESYYNVVRTPAVAGGSNDRLPVFLAPFDLTLEEAVFLSDAAMTGAATNNFTLTVLDGGTAGAGTSVMATLAFTGTGTVVGAYDKESFTVSATVANLNLDAGDVMLFDKTEGGTGLALEAGYLYVKFKSQ
jgi:hypothetical protein